MPESEGDRIAHDHSDALLRNVFNVTMFGLVAFIVATVIVIY